MAILNVELTGSILIVFILVRYVHTSFVWVISFQVKLNAVINATYWLMGGLKVFLPPTEEEYARIAVISS